MFILSAYVMIAHLKTVDLGLNEMLFASVKDRNDATWVTTTGEGLRSIV
ncbi:MAG: hypothetical protein JOY96_12130 [Verrucomicrobia bacterium]|nr:hypothetical protein [Verrucomicrobiota bacterium]